MLDKDNDEHMLDKQNAEMCWWVSMCAIVIRVELSYIVSEERYSQVLNSHT